MVEQDQVVKWIIGTDADEQAEKAKQLLEASRLAWPRVLAHVRRELAGQRLSSGEITSQALEIWEKVLRSVWSTLRRKPEGTKQIENLENYLIGTFHHRLNRHLKQKRHRDAVLDFLPPTELAELNNSGSTDGDYALRLQRTIQLKEVYSAMDDRVKKAVIARMYGFSWSEIAKTFQIEEQNLIMRVQYAIRKIRAKLRKGKGTTPRIATNEGTDLQ